MAGLPGWMLLISGLAIVAATVLTPTWMSLREVDWQRQVMREQIERLERQRERYAQFHAALVDDDPVLLERLAYTQLRYQPVEAMLMAEADALDASIAAYLAEPAQGVLPARPPTIDTRLVRLTTGPTRAPLLAAGLLCLVGGLWMGGAGRRGGVSPA